MLRLVFVCLALPGCGYALGTGALIDPAYRELSIPAFRNSTIPLRRGLEERLTRAVHKEVLRMEGVVLRETNDSSAARLEGEIVDVEEQVSLEGRADVLRAVRVEMRVTVRLIPARGSSSQPVEHELVGIGSSSVSASGDKTVAFDRAIRELARSLVALLEKRGGRAPAIAVTSRDRSSAE